MSGTSSVYHPMLDNLTARLAKIVKQIRGEARLTEANIQDALREVRVALLEADVALPVVKHFIEAVRASALGEEVIGSLTPGQALVGLVHRELARLMGGANVGLDLATQPPAVILMAGLQGSGKTTTAGKLAKLLAADKKKVALVSCDVYRPAAIEQLKAVAAQAGADFVESKSGENPVDIARRALEHAKTRYFDVLIVDTAGRLAIDEEMMREIAELHAVLKPVETLFIVDAMQGQDAVNVARAFAALLDKLPAQLAGQISPAQLQDDRQIRRIEGIINSMTPAERADPSILKASRKRRIAAGAGVPVQAVNQLLNQFEQMQKMMKMMKGGNMARMLRNMKGMLPGMR